MENVDKEFIEKMGQAILPPRIIDPEYTKVEVTDTNDTYTKWQTFKNTVRNTFKKDKGYKRIFKRDAFGGVDTKLRFLEKRILGLTIASTDNCANMEKSITFLTGLNPSNVQRVIRSGRVRINDSPCNINSKLKSGDVITYGSLAYGKIIER